MHFLKFTVKVNGTVEFKEIKKVVACQIYEFHIESSIKIIKKSQIKHVFTFDLE